MYLKNKKKVIITVIAVVAVFILFAACILFVSRKYIFQCGNPVPYLIAASKLSDKNPYVQVNGKEGVYLTKKNDKAELFAYLEETTGMQNVDQWGSGYVFSDGKQYFVAVSQTYWRYFSVWEIYIMSID